LDHESGVWTWKCKGELGELEDINHGDSTDATG